jgi:hypothetical protein
MPQDFHYLFYLDAPGTARRAGLATRANPVRILRERAVVQAELEEANDAVGRLRHRVRGGAPRRALAALVAQAQRVAEEAFHPAYRRIPFQDFT